MKWRFHEYTFSIQKFEKISSARKYLSKHQNQYLSLFFKKDKTFRENQLENAVGTIFGLFLCKNSDNMTTVAHTSTWTPMKRALRELLEKNAVISVTLSYSLVTTNTHRQICHENVQLPCIKTSAQNRSIFRLFPIISISQKIFSIFFLTLEKIGIDEKVICYHNISN